MQTKAQVVSALIANLEDERIYGVALFVDRLIRRDVYSAGINQYRIKNLDTGAFITDIASFEAALNSAGITTSYPFNGAVLSADRVVGYTVRVDNLEVSFSDNSPEDSVFTEVFGGGNRKYSLQFYMVYPGDNDPSLPVKISSVRLVTTL